MYSNEPYTGEQQNYSNNKPQQFSEFLISLPCLFNGSYLLGLLYGADTGVRSDTSLMSGLTGRRCPVKHKTGLFLLSILRVFCRV